MVRLVPLAALLLCGCFTTEAVGREPMQRLRGRVLTADTVLHEDPSREGRLFGGGVRLDAGSKVRLRRGDGSWTSWFGARHLLLSDDGLLVGVRAVPWDEVAFVEATGVPEGRREALARSTPEGARLEVTDLGVRLHPGPSGVKAWLHPALDDAAAFDTRWKVHTRSAGPLPERDDAEMRAALQGPLRVPDGLRWADLDGAEVNNFHGGLTWLGIVGFIGTLGTGSFAAPLLMPSGAFGAPAAEVHPSGPRLLGDPAFPPPRVDGARPLFDDRTRRDARMRGLVSLGAGAHLAGLERAAITLAGGVRLRDVVELGFGVSTFWQAPRAVGYRLPGPPLSPGPSSRTPQVFALLQAGLHLEVDARRRLALPLAIAAGTSADGAGQLRFRYGARVRLARRLWVGVHPFNALYTTRWGWGFPTSLELVHEL
jgi:hypothetical protein